MDVFRSCGAEDIDLIIGVFYEGQCNFILPSKALKLIGEMGINFIRIIISPLLLLKGFFFIVSVLPSLKIKIPSGDKIKKRNPYFGGTILMEVKHPVRLTSAEIAGLWSSYMNDSMLICVLKYFINKVEDADIQSVLEYGLEISQSHINKMKKIFQGENYPIPIGFNMDDDVDINAPRLYSDTYFLNYLREIGQIGMNHYSMTVSLSAREDIYDYFSQCLAESNKLHKMAKDLLLSKGLFIRPPYLPTPSSVSFIEKKQNFLTGWFGNRRPLTGAEISQLYANIQRNEMCRATLLGFVQTVKNQEVKTFLEKGRDITFKHIEIFSSLMREDNLPVPMTLDNEVMNSTSAAFSDKLMIFQIIALNTIGVTYYGVSMALSPRHDIVAHYTRLTAEVALYLNEGANIMIDNGWLEQPPQNSHPE